MAADSGSIVKWGLLGLAGWWLYNQFIAAPLAPATAASASAGADHPQPPAPTPAATQAGGIGWPTIMGSAPAIPSLAAMKAAAAANQPPLPKDASGNITASVDQWAWLAAHNGATVGSDLIDKMIEAEGGDRSRPLTAEQFNQLFLYASGQVGGLTGFRGFGRVMYPASQPGRRPNYLPARVPMVRQLNYISRLLS